MRYETVIRVIAESKMCVVPNKTFSAPPALPLARLASRSDELSSMFATSRMTADRRGSGHAGAHRLKSRMKSRA